MDASGDGMDMVGERTGDRQRLPGCTVGQERVDHREGLSQRCQCPFGGTLDRDAECLQGVEYLDRTIEVDGLRRSRKEDGLRCGLGGVEQCREGVSRLGRLDVELLTEGGQVDLIDTDTRQFHFHDGRETVPLQCCNVS